MTWLPGGHNDWFSVSVSGPNFQLQFNRRASTLYQNFNDAADNAAQLLYKEWGGRPLYLALSGGLDSELVARILLKNKIPFTPIILKIENLNHLETWYAEYWCHVNNIKPIILKYSVDDIAKEAARLSPKLVQLKNYNMTPTLLIYEYAQQLGGHGIFCGGDINFDFKRKEFFCASLDFVSNIVDSGKHPTAFFMYTPEIALSYINQFNINQDEQYNKIAFYQVLPRPKIDYVTSLRDSNQLQHLLIQMNKVFKMQWLDQKYWYGTKEQLMQDLQP